MTFEEFNQRLSAHVAEMLQDQQFVFVMDVDPDVLWEIYLESFPAGTNLVYRKRREYDCSCCRHFIKRFGAMVAIINNEIATIWDFDAKSTMFQPVIDALNVLVKGAKIRDVLVTKDALFGTELSHEMREGGEVHTWHHFWYELPERFVDTSPKSVSEVAAQYRDSRNVLKRSLDELSPDAVDTVLDLIAEKQLYRGQEWLSPLTKFSAMQANYAELDEHQRENYCWAQAVEIGPAISRIRNHSIGQLLIDITDGMDILDAVHRYEHIVAPSNYKRPKEIYTSRMVEQAEKTVTELGLAESLPRRFAVIDDLTINDVLFADRNVRPTTNGTLSVFDEMKRDVATVDPGNFDNVHTIGIEEFLSGFKGASTIEVLLENRLSKDLVSLIAPQNKTAPSLFKWENGFSWAYTGNLTDSAMKERVKAKGGKVDDVALRFSIQWNDDPDKPNLSDMDAHCLEPLAREHIYYGNKRSRSGGELDVDMFVGTPSNHRQIAVENIVYKSEERMEDGIYTFFVKNFNDRRSRSGFTAEIEFDGHVFEFEYADPVRHKDEVEVAKVRYRNGFKIVSSLQYSTSQRNLWGMTTNQWKRVALVCNSPNHWTGEQGLGHKHVFFMLADARNDESPNGFYNEYLPERLLEHKRVFAAIGSKMRVEDSENQLSGIGFSTTRRNYVVVRLDGKKVVKVVF